MYTHVYVHICIYIYIYIHNHIHIQYSYNPIQYAIVCARIRASCRWEPGPPVLSQAPQGSKRGAMGSKNPPCILLPLCVSAQHGSKNPGFVLRTLVSF